MDSEHSDTELGTGISVAADAPTLGSQASANAGASESSDPASADGLERMKTMILQVTRSLEALTQRRAFGRWKDIVQRLKRDGSTTSREASALSFYETATGPDRESLLISRIDRLDESQQIVVDAMAKLEERSATLFTTIMDKMEDLSRRLKSRGDDEEIGTLSSMQLERRELAQPRILTESVGATPNPSETGSATSPVEVGPGADTVHFLKYAGSYKTYGGKPLTICMGEVEVITRKVDRRQKSTHRAPRPPAVMSAAMADCRAPVISELDETLRSLTPQGVTKILKAEYTLMKNGKAAFLRDVWAGRRVLYAGRGDLPSSKADSDKRVAWLRRLVHYDQSAAGNDVYSGLYPTPHHITQLPRLSVLRYFVCRVLHGLVAVEEVVAAAACGGRVWVGPTGASATVCPMSTAPPPAASSVIMMCASHC